MMECGSWKSLLCRVYEEPEMELVLELHGCAGEEEARA